MDTGLGKTRTAMELMRVRQHKIDRIVYFCPCSLKETVRHQFLEHTDIDPVNVIVFDDKINERTIPADGLVFIIGIESMSASARVICTAVKIITENTFVIVDESHYIKGHRAQRTQRITYLSKHCRYRLLLTATPLTQGVVDLFAQMRFLSPNILGYQSFYSFAANHLEYSDKYKGLIVRAHNTEWLAEKIRPYVYQVQKDEVIGLPDKIYEDYHCSLTLDQQDAYERAKEQFVADVLEYDDGGQYQPSIPIFRLFTNLQKIVCGFDTTSGELRALHNRRLGLLMSVINGIPADEKVVIWAKYRFCIHQIATVLSDEYGADSVSLYYGNLGERKRAGELERWGNGGRFFIATQATGGHGLNDLVRSRYAVFYAGGFKFSEWKQAEDRQHHRGNQVNPCTYLRLWAHSKIDARISGAIAQKRNVLQDFQREVNKVKKLSDGKERIKKLISNL